MGKKIAYFDCFAGVSGDMIIGSLIHAGLELKRLRRALAGLGLKECRIEARLVRRGGLSGTKFAVRIAPGAEKRAGGLGAILPAIRRSGLPEPVKERAEKIFHELSRVEKRVHGTAAEPAHLHELGALDAMMDIVGAVAGLHILGVGEVYASALPWNSGTVRCSHGVLPVPAPATAELMKDIPVYSHAFPRELVTPTGAAILKVCAAGFGHMPPMIVRQVGYGAGDAHLSSFPNLLRCVIGEADELLGGDRVAVIETEIDDMPPSLYDHINALLFSAGALDLFTAPVFMKKNRPGHLLTVLCRRGDVASLTDIILRESTTLGVRVREEERVTLTRKIIRVRTPYGAVRVKMATRPGGSVTTSPEYDDCSRLAKKARVPLMTVMNAAAHSAGLLRNSRSGKTGGKQ